MTKFAFVSAERANHAVTTLCGVIGVSVSGFMPGCRRSPPFNAGLRRKQTCAGISAVSLPHAAKSTAPRGSMLNCAGKDGVTRVGALNG